jgi:hypothetical protein
MYECIAPTPTSQTAPTAHKPFAKTSLNTHVSIKSQPYTSNTCITWMKLKQRLAGGPGKAGLFV